MNKLAIVAFTLLVFFSCMLWYLANGSINEYLKSQVKLQGHYYSGQTVTLNEVDYAANLGTIVFKGINLVTVEDNQAKNILTIDQAYVELSQKHSSTSLTVIEKVTINKLTLHVEQEDQVNNNIEKLINYTAVKLAHDYPEQYPQISAKIYAEKHPDLNAEVYAKENSLSAPIVEYKKKNKTRNKAQPSFKISLVHIKNLEINSTNLNSTKTRQQYNINLASTETKEGIVANQIGGEILIKLLSTYKVDQVHELPNMQ